MQLRPLPFSAGPIFAVSFWVTFASWIVPELLAWKLKRSADSSRAQDEGSLRLIALLWWTGIAIDFSLSLLVPQAAIPWKRSSFFFLGICLMLLGIALRWYSVRILGKYFTFDVAIQREQVLIEIGPYRYIRHPSYAGALVSLLGFGLALGNWAGTAASLSCLGFAYAYRIPVEESALSSALGEAYKSYMRRTWRLVPFLF
jgi:protein-S-isoprenylcysteine O-methyltransferase